MSAGVRPEPISDADLWEELVRGGMSKAEATAQVEARRAGGKAKAPLALDVRQRGESTRALPFNRPEPTGDLEADLPAVLGNVANLAQGVPGMEAVQSGARALVRGQSFKEARDDIRGATDNIPAPIKIAGRVAGSLPLLPFMPASPALGGAALGAADQALSADDMTLEGRLARTAAGAGGGAAIGKTLDMLVTGARAYLPSKLGGSKTFGKTLLDREDAMGAADEVAYGAAAREGTTAGGTNDAIRDVLSHEKIAPFAAAVRMREQFKGATDAEVLTEAYKLMSREQRRLGKTIANADDFAAGDVLRKEEIDILKQRMLAAADDIMPSFRGAVRGHAQREGEIEAAEAGAGAMSRAGMKINPSQADRFSPEAFSRKFAGMSAAERKAAEEGVLGYLKEQPIVRPNLISAGGILSSADRVHRAGGLLRKINTDRQRWLDDVLKTGLLGTGGVTR